MTDSLRVRAPRADELTAGAALAPAGVHATIIAGLDARGWVVVDDALPAPVLSRLREGALDNRRRTDFRRAAIGARADNQIRTDVRGDLIRWLGEPETEGRAVAEFTAFIDALRLDVNRHWYLGLTEFEGHFAVYPPGTFYARHLDRFRHGGRRRLSVIVYLNDGWRPEHGGELRLFLGDSDDAVDLLPHGGRLVAFWSDAFHHEVRTATRERLSLTGWLLDRA